MRKSLTILGILTLVSPALPQAFQDLVTNTDGSVLYFASPIRQKGTNQSFHSKIFRWTQREGIQVAAEVSDPGMNDGCASSNFYNLHAPQIALEDPAVVAYTATKRYVPNRYCAPIEPNEGVILRSGQTRRLEGALALSPNGRFAITTPVNAVTNEYHVVTDLNSGISTLVAGEFNGSNRRVTNEGATLAIKPSAVFITERTGQTRVLPTKWPVNDAVIDPAGAIVVYVTSFSPGTPARISALSVATGLEVELFTGLHIGNPILSADGSTAFYFANDGRQEQLYSSPTSGGNARPITPRPGGLVSASVSGDRRVAFLGTASSELIRIDVASGAVMQLIGPTPIITSSARLLTQFSTATAVGSRVALQGAALPSIRQFMFCGRTINLQLNGTAFQVPWDTPEGPCRATLASDSPFESAFDFTIQQYDPQFTAAGDFIHEGFRGFVLESDPARIGEVITTYMTGLGPLDATGRIAPGFGCQVDASMAEIVYAGQAPGADGFYQINLRVPMSVSRQPNLFCGWDPSRRASTQIWVGR